MGKNAQFTEDESLICTVKGLQQGVSYKFRVTAICGSAGESEASNLSNPLSVVLPQSQFQTSKILDHCDLVRPAKDGRPAVYTLPLSPVYEDNVRHLRKFEINLEKGKTTQTESFQGPPEKVIMAVGSKGSGKTTILNAMVNHILGVQWKDDFRFKMIQEISDKQEEEKIGNEARSQSQYVSCYTLPHIEGFKVPYTITVVDTPSFGNTRGLEHFKLIIEQIPTLFDTKGQKWIDHVDAICFVVQAGNPRLTLAQQYVFCSILSMFGKDIKENIIVFFSLADGQRPQALSAMLEAGILDDDSHYFKFNNSALLVDNSDGDDEDNFDGMFWKMGIKSFEKFFAALAKMEACQVGSLDSEKQAFNAIVWTINEFGDQINHGLKR